ncbi:Gfo/Idh/MocA family oxidoreductase [Ketobacter sp. MCCC 1A13808]|uniref:Gfo/Idh/MocA family protein n=1 Tax=Ketobacter sp. MCCC 1A13808 TaxID=2602738 RepID=UPI0012EB7688|nr:Gfo/Idh/MocA family oxidoreductase [Ketobacter sp. MCCC 1A13808]MVF12828.1 Gfo/Idh/MocA family oxidoreductase [Ketobacter sp. MCCC 1A13808]
MNLLQQEPLQIAFIGGGVHSAVGYAHFNATRLDGQFRLVAGCFSRNAEQNQLSASTYGVNPERTYPTWQALLDAESGQLDAIIVLTPTPVHAEVVVSALNAGFAVICEKALGMSSEECLRIEQVRSEKQGYLAVTFNYSGYPMVREIRRTIREGKLGTLQQIQVEMPQEGYLRKGANPQIWRRSDYGVPTVSLDLGVHVHHLVDFITLGKKPVSVVGDQASYGQFAEVIDNVYSIARYEDNVRVQSWWGKSALGYRNGLRIRVFGSEGSAEWYQMDPEILSFSDNTGRTFRLDRGSSEAGLAMESRYNRFKAGHPSGFIEAFANLYADIATDVRCYRNGCPDTNEFVYGSLNAAEGMLFLEKVSESSKTNKWVLI